MAESSHAPSPSLPSSSDEQSEEEREPQLVLWRALACASLAMFAIGHAQYTWTLFVQHFQKTLEVSEAEVQVAFSFFVTLQTTTVLAIGVLVAAEQRRLFMVAGSLALGIGMVGMSGAQSLWMLYACCALVGFGVGAIYCNAISISVSIFPSRRGLVAGITAAFYGGGSLLTVAAIASSIEVRGGATTLRYLGLALATLCLTASLGLPRETAGRAEAKRMLLPERGDGARDLRLSEAARQPSFWLLYVMLVLITFVGLVVVSQIKPIGEARLIPEESVVLAMQFDRVLNFASRPTWGYLSDHIGRANALGLAFGLQACTLLLWAFTLSSPAAFVICSALSTFSWGEVYSLFPAFAADLYGTEHVSANYGCLYTGKAVASVLAGPVASSVASALGWEAIVVLMAAASGLDALLALLVLKPMVSGHRLELRA